MLNRWPAAQDKTRYYIKRDFITVSDRIGFVDYNSTEEMFNKKNQRTNIL